MISTPDLCDAYGDGLTVLQPLFNNYGGCKVFCGRVVTIKCFEDNSKVKALAAVPGEGRIMVIDGGGSLRTALLGDTIAANALSNGWIGFVINGCIRDVDALRAMNLGVQALAIHPMRSGKRDLGDVDVPVTFAGATIYPNDFMVCDNNGILVSPVELDV